MFAVRILALVFVRWYQYVVWREEKGRRNERRKKGRKKGRKEERKKGRKEGRKEERKKGRKEGRKKGRKEGRKRGVVSPASLRPINKRHDQILRSSFAS